MRNGPTDSLIEHLRRAVLPPDGAGLGDGELLGRFVERHDEAAFAVLVNRHGPMVWGVCRRLLHQHDAEDAFQATFLILATKAASIRSKEMVGNWLHGVAHQTALQARRTAARRRAREVQVMAMPDAEAKQQGPWADVQPLLDDELRRLPEIYKTVIVLCDLEGRTRREIACQLGVPEGTVAGRLARARTMLAGRLTQRGVTLSGGALAAFLAQQASAGVPKSVVLSTIKAASVLVVGKAAATGAVSVKVAALTEGVKKAMLFNKLKSAIAVVLMLGLTATGTTLLIYRTAAGQDEKKSTAEKPVEPAAKKEKGQDGKKPPRSVSDQDKLQGTWRIVELIVDGQPARRQNPTEEANMVVRGDQISMVALPEGKKVKEFRFKIDPAKMPKAIDLCVPTDQDKGKTGHGIYELEGDRWKLCFPQDDNEAKERPKSFKSEAGSRLVLMTLKREVKR
jgi:RNA polymerase sigma factor (sigma-70 family)